MSSRVSYKSVWFWLAIALVADFSTRQVYLFFRPAKTKPANQAEANPPALATSALTRLNEFLRSQKTKMILVISPGSSQMDYLDPDSRAQAVWQSWGSANTVPVISLYPEFFAQASVYPSMVQSSGHWNSKGHELVADVLIRKLPDLLPELRPKP